MWEVDKIVRFDIFSLFVHSSNLFATVPQFTPFTYSKDHLPEGGFLSRACYNLVMNSTILPVPSEDDEENMLAEYCDLRGWKHTHFSNETYTTSWKQKAKMKYLGVSSGVPDHLVIVKRPHRAPVPVYIEMKRQKGGTLSDTQFKWIDALYEAGQYVAVCESGHKAIIFLEAVENDVAVILDDFRAIYEEKREKWLKRLKKREKMKKDCPF